MHQARVRPEIERGRRLHRLSAASRLPQLALYYSINRYDTDGQRKRNRDIWHREEFYFLS
jgi:predicted trehalose synthase